MFTVALVVFAVAVFVVLAVLALILFACGVVEGRPCRERLDLRVARLEGLA